MKKSIKHHFIHKDPEAQLTKVEKSEEGKEASVNVSQAPSFLKKDFIRTITTISIFILLIIILYILETKTSLLRPVLKLFSL